MTRRDPLAYMEMRMKRIAIAALRIEADKLAQHRAALPLK